VADQRTGGGANGCTNHRTPRAAPTGDIPNNRTCASAGGGALAGWSIARVQTKRGQQNAASNREKLFVHNDFFVSPLNRASKRMLRLRTNLLGRGK
jgi:hypothetical protein